MPISIRDPRAAMLARELATRRRTTMTGAIVAALENELERERSAQSLTDRLQALAKKAQAQAGRKGRAMSKAERDALWGNE